MKIPKQYNEPYCPHCFKKIEQATEILTPDDTFETFECPACKQPSSISAVTLVKYHVQKTIVCAICDDIVGLKYAAKDYGRNKWICISCADENGIYHEKR